MDDILLVDIFRGHNQLMHVVLDFKLSQFLSSLDQLIKCLVIAEFQNDIHELTVFEKLFKLDNIWRLYFGMNLDLWGELNFILEGTFSLALDRVSVDLSIILTADFLLVLRLMT